jgi:hypothetical protein
MRLAHASRDPLSKKTKGAREVEGEGRKATERSDELKIKHPNQLGIVVFDAGMNNRARALGLLLSTMAEQRDRRHGESMPQEAEGSAEGPMKHERTPSERQKGKNNKASNEAFMRHTKLKAK